MPVRHSLRIGHRHFRVALAPNLLGIPLKKAARSGVQFLTVVPDFQKSNQPEQPAPDPAAGPHQIPDIKKTLRDLKRVLLLPKPRSFLHDAKVFQPLELSGNLIHPKRVPELGDQIRRGQRVPMDRHRINHLLRLRRQLLETPLVKSGVLVEELFDVPLNVALWSLSQDFE